MFALDFYSTLPNFLFVNRLSSEVLDSKLGLGVNLETMSHGNPFCSVNKLIRKLVAISFIANNTIVNVKVINSQTTVLL